MSSRAKRKIRATLTGSVTRVGKMVRADPGRNTEVNSGETRATFSDIRAHIGMFFVLYEHMSDTISTYYFQPLNRLDCDKNGFDPSKCRVLFGVGTMTKG